MSLRLRHVVAVKSSKPLYQQRQLPLQWRELSSKNIPSNWFRLIGSWLGDTEIDYSNEQFLVPVEATWSNHIASSAPETAGEVTALPQRYMQRGPLPLSNNPNPPLSQPSGFTASNSLAKILDPPLYFHVGNIHRQTFNDNWTRHIRSAMCYLLIAVHYTQWLRNPL